MSKITINIIQAKIRAIHEFMQKDDGDHVLTLTQASDKLYNLMQQIQKTIETYPPEDDVNIERREKK